MPRHVCSKCGYSAESVERVSKHIDNAHGEAVSSEDKYGNTSPSYQYRPRIMTDETDPEEDSSAVKGFIRDLLTFRR